MVESFGGERCILTARGEELTHRGSDSSGVRGLRAQPRLGFLQLSPGQQVVVLLIGARGEVVGGAIDVDLVLPLPLRILPKCSPDSVGRSIEIRGSRRVPKVKVEIAVSSL